jgi:NAD+ synthase (glutamine-hydrolysing)
MAETLRLSLHQINTTVGDIAANEARIKEGLEAARAAGAQVALFPELAVTGYPPEDLLLKEHFLRDAHLALERIAAEVHGLVAVVGFPERAEDVFNAAALLADGAIQGIYRKIYLPNYGVFDEKRYFRSGAGAGVFDLGPVRVGVTVCEDVWEPGPPASDEALAGARLILNLSASPYHEGKGLERERMFGQRARDNLAAFAFCNLVGGQDELVFDGHSFVLDHEGGVVARAEQFVESHLVCEVDLGRAAATRLRDARLRPAAGSGSEDGVDVLAALPLPPAQGPPPEPRVARLREPIEDEIYAALTLGLRDYVRKNGFTHVVLGVSGGIDSALVACLAVDALGREAVSAVLMPSPFSSAATREDGRALLANLGLEPLELGIVPAMDAYRDILSAVFDGLPEDIAEENLQARIRGTLLMALSNKFGWLVLTTGNKSELSVGYSTLYGDLAGGFAVLKDCPKTLVYRLAEHRNRLAREHTERDLIPRSILERAPSAELRPDQLDEDSLPPYSLLDRILEGYIEQDLGLEDLVALGLPQEEVERVIRLVDVAEYKRRQAPPGIKISTRAFGRDRRMPITNRYGG